MLVTVTDFLGTDYVEHARGGGVELPDLGHDRRRPRAGAPAGTESWDGVPGAGHRRRGVPRSTDGPPPSGPTTRPTSSSPRGRRAAPKGVVQTHGRTLRVATDWVAMTGLCADDRYLMVNPYFHMFGLKAGILACVATGATMLPEAVFDVDRVLTPGAARAGHRAARSAHALPGHPRPSRAATDYDLSSLRVAVTGAADIPVELIRRMRRRAAVLHGGHRLRADRGGHGRGTSPEDDVETIATTVGPARARASSCASSTTTAATCRRATPARSSCAAAASCPATSTIPRPPPRPSPPTVGCAPATSGWSTPRAACASSGRSKDMFIVGGLQRLPGRDRERPARAIPQSPQAAVIGIPDERLGEVGMAFVVTRPGHVDRRVRDHRVEPRPRWPTTRSRGWSRSSTSCRCNATGKVQKDVLRARVASR